METKITSTKKEKVTLSSRSELSDVFINVNVNYRKDNLINEGTETEKVIGTEYITGFKQVQFNLETLKELDTINISKLVEEAISAAKEKH